LCSIAGSSADVLDIARSMERSSQFAARASRALAHRTHHGSAAAQEWRGGERAADRAAARRSRR